LHIGLIINCEINVGVLFDRYVVLFCTIWMLNPMCQSQAIFVLVLINF